MLSLACFVLPHPALWPLQNLICTGAILHQRRDTRFQVNTRHISEFMNCVFRWNHWILCVKLQKCLTLPRRNGSVIADYKLTFHMPEEEKDQLRNFTLSREMVYNVFRQFLYDQESELDPMFIDPASLKMVLGNWGQEVYSETRKPVLGFFLVFMSH